MTLIILIIVLLSVLMVPLSLKKLIDNSRTGRDDKLPGFDMSGEGEHRIVMESRAGYGIEIDEVMPEGIDSEALDRIVIALHGFSGSKESRAIILLQRLLTGKGVGLVKFDWPAHGRSMAKDSDLTITNCLSDLDMVIDHVKRKFPGAERIAFATSFGGYLAMLYNARHQDAFKRIILRSPALRFGWILREVIAGEEMQRQLKECGYFETGFDRKIRVYEGFIEEAERSRIEDIYGGFGDESRDDIAGESRDDITCGRIALDPGKVTIIHGDADELVPYDDSVAFARAHGIELYTVEGADHRYTGEGMLEEAVAFAARRITDESADYISGVDG